MEIQMVSTVHKDWFDAHDWFDAQGVSSRLVKNSQLFQSVLFLSSYSGMLQDNESAQ